MKQNFPKSLEHVLVHEGGYVDYPNDPDGIAGRNTYRALGLTA